MISTNSLLIYIVFHVMCLVWILLKLSDLSYFIFSFLFVDLKKVTLECMD